MDDFLRVRVYSLFMSTNKSQFHHVGTFLSRKGAETVRRAMAKAGISGSFDTEFEIKKSDDLLRKDRIAELRKQGYTVKVIGDPYGKKRANKG